ncbi:sugar transferase [Nocardioides nitrophenolicus]|uniref:sugar transferase n=1 Tax=Nocardioides nitrophenolicus TaxID=60489 RepID=UPI00195A3A9A|nr:sugar transferase [Nocardioides nitrophenolicus]MBM7518718.1 exopolysaccharide biosynthesis polyprenyl glycosylphosphotransferase [Nocardioides nitrophenolicus]
MSVVDGSRVAAPAVGGRRATRRTPRLALPVLDAVLILAACAIALVGQASIPIFIATSAVRDHIGVSGPAIALGWLVALQVTGSRQPSVLGAGTEEFKRLLRATAVTAGITGIVCYLLKYQLSRGFFLLVFVVGGLLLLLGRLVARRVLHGLRRRGRFQVPTLIVGTPSGIDALAARLRKDDGQGYVVTGGLTITDDRSEETPGGTPVLGSAHDVETIAELVRPALVVFAKDANRIPRQLNQWIWSLEQRHIEVALAPDLDDIAQERVTMRPVDGAPLLLIEHSRWTQAGRIGKRAFDLGASAALLLLASPVLALAALWIRLHDRGPVLFKHTRVGRLGSSFDCWKLRTMVVDAAALDDSLRASSDQTALLFKLKEDPRVTRPGRWLRRYSIDELPQLVNVLRGEMSLVGPRPQVTDEVELYDDDMARRLLVRPGITGLWQVSGRSDLSAEEAMRLDLYYVDNWSMVRDLAILAHTANAVLSSRGAY